MNLTCQGVISGSLWEAIQTTDEPFAFLETDRGIDQRIFHKLHPMIKQSEKGWENSQYFRVARPLFDCGKNRL